MSRPALPYEGECRCGQVRFRVSAPPMLTMACHCTGCQKMTAGPYSLSAAFPAEAFEVTAGEPVQGGLHGADRHMHCPHCMSWMFSRISGLDFMVNVRTPMFGREVAAALAPFVDTMTSEKLPFAQSGAPHAFEAFPAEAEFPHLMQAYPAWAP